MSEYVKSPAETRAILAKVLPLLGSSSDGEALAAARAAAKAQEQSGLTWGQLLQTTPAPASPPPCAAVEVVRSRDGKRQLTPPVGTTWNETVLWLVQREAHSQLIAGRHALDLLAVRLQRARTLRLAADITFDEAAEISRLYARVSAP